MEVKDKVKGSSTEIPKAGGMVQVKGGNFLMFLSK